MYVANIFINDFILLNEKGGYMKNHIFVLLVIILFIVPLSQGLVIGNYPKIDVTLLSQSPDPVEPGQIVTVKFKIENEGKETTDDTIVTIIPKFPFKLYGGTATQNVGKLRAGSTGADAVIVEYKLKVDEEAVEGESEIELTVNMGENGVSYKNDEFLIDIQTHDAVLEISSITSDPSEVPPGGTAEISFLVKNLADSLLKDITFKLDFDATNSPLAPYRSSSERILSQLKSGYQNTLTFNVIAEPDAVGGLYKIPLDITYNDEKGNAYSVSDILAVNVGSAPAVRPLIKKSTVLQEKKEGIITLSIVNAGTTNVKLLELFIEPSEDFQLISTSDYFYIGDVDSDDTESEEINIYVNNNVDILRFPVKLQYRDANNKPYQQHFELEMNLYSSSQLKRFGVLESSNAGVYFFIILCIVVGIFLYRGYKKNPEEFLYKWRKRIPFLKKKKK
ncbi:hypothetical protein COV17_01195 [Candidatus Woesearchaeota archaeon CG10_big_fil_rev_8_21_14_0_10_36_11]|nr:MAG: hypothetical protein COV17_01195 [Candidatus Woesearchaeota archaeon CG10_big_fil_rev_8_21_14_0_10_36_11]